MASEATRRRKLTGRSTPRYVGIPLYVYNSEEFGALDGWSLKLLIELAGQYNGFNNGDLSCAWSDLKARGWRSTGTLWKAIRRLLAANWIIPTRHGSRNRCALYALTWAPIDACEGKQLEVKPTPSASNAWQKTKSVPAMRSNVPAMRSPNDGNW